MPHREEARWLKSTANELNNLLQIIREAQESLAALLPNDPQAAKYLHILDTSLGRAMEVGRTLSARAEKGVAEPVPPAESPAPQPAPARVEEPSSKPEFEIQNPNGPRELLLIVDDEEFIIMLAEQVLADAGYRVVTARDGFQALEIYKQLKDEIALVILDFMMPVMDGEDVFAEMQLLNPRVPVVLSSGFAEQDRLRNMLARGLRGFIPKPYTQQKLLAQIRQTLDALA